MSPKSKIECSLDAERLPYLVLGSCVLVAAVFFLLDYHVNYGRWTQIGALRRMFNTTREDSLASWFGVTQTLFVALTVWVLYWFSQGASKWRRRGWLVLALFFTYMAVDDGATIHERLGTAYDVKMLSGEDSVLDFFPSYAWQIAVLPGFVVLGFFTFFFLLRELRTRRAKILLFLALSGLAFAVGLDFIEGLERDHPLNVFARAAERYDFAAWTQSRFQHSEFSTVVHFSKSVEETLEMMSMSVIWFVFLQHLLGSTDALVVRFRRRAPLRSSNTELSDDAQATQEVVEESLLPDP
jgi:hypothetical protein